MRSNLLSQNIASPILPLGRILGCSSPVSLMANVVIVREVGNNQAPQFERIDFSLPLVDDFPAWPNQHGIRNGRVPFGIKSRDECVDVIRGQKKVAITTTDKKCHRMLVDSLLTYLLIQY
jgi:hypothetical protein